MRVFELINRLLKIPGEKDVVVAVEGKEYFGTIKSIDYYPENEKPEDVVLLFVAIDERKRL